MLNQTETYSFTPVSVGPDWLTATAKAGSEGEPFREVGETLIHEARAAGVEIKPAALRDYRGRRADGIYFGERDADSIIVLSGSRCPPNFKRVARTASNVSRLDLQVTLWTHGETPHLANLNYRQLDRLPPRRGRKASLTYIESKPQGECVYYGKRISDSFGRIYDKASEAKMGEPRTLWRYEVEYKRHHARGLADALSRLDDPRCAIESHVHHWWADRGAVVPWNLTEESRTDFGLNCDLKRDVLRWFESSVSKTVARAIMAHGLEAVLASLKLSEYVEPIRRAYGDSRSNADLLIQARRDRRAARTNHSD